MGRPINKRFLGEPSVAGDEIKVQFHNGTTTINGWIVKQRGSKRFVCTDGTNTVTCTLVDKASADILEGEMTISVKADDGNVHQVTKIAGRKVTYADGGNNVAIKWNFTDAADDEAVEMEEAGDDDSFTNSDDFELDGI